MFTIAFPGMLRLIGFGSLAIALVVSAAVVRLQHERAHTVADAGVYAIVRHPFYAADPFILLGLGLWLESYAAALGAVIPVALMVLRLQGEERFLRRALPEYHAYMERVPYRLVPGVW